MKKSYHHCSMSIFFVGTTFFITHMHKTIRLTIRYWSILVKFRGIWEFWRFYGILHKNWQCWSNVIIPRSDTSQIFTSELYFFSLSWRLRLAQFSDLLRVTLLLTKSSSFCVTNTFQSISRAIAVWSGKQQTSKWLKKQLKWISRCSILKWNVSVFVKRQACRVLSLCYKLRITL